MGPETVVLGSEGARNLVEEPMSSRAQDSYSRPGHTTVVVNKHMSYVSSVSREILLQAACLHDVTPETGN